jgi:nickel-dependent lactate racemase
MLIRLPYGDGVWEEEVPGLTVDCVVEPPAALPPLPDLALARREARQAPIGSRRLREIVRPGESIVVVINDATRPSPSRLFLDAIVEELKTASVSLDSVTVVVATGTHRPSTPAELTAMLGEEHLARFKVVSHVCTDATQMVSVGKTGSGLPVSINRIVAEAARRIITGTIAPHHIAGYSGGRKSIVPGVASAETIQKFHSPLIQLFQPTLGWLEGNPTHEAALEAAKMVGVDFMINAVPEPGGKAFLQVVAGDLEAAYVEGVRACERACRVQVPFQADLTICSPGGYPRDINLHQSQKALSIAEMVTRPGGVIILVTECRNGAEGKFVEYLQEAQTPRQVIERWQTGQPPMSSGKAMQFARACKQFHVIVVSRAFSPEFLSSLFLHYADCLQEAVARVRERLGPQPRTLVIPHASKLIPVV